MNSKRGAAIIKNVIKLTVAGFIIVNAIAFVHAYKFTHFTSPNAARTKDPKELSAVEKMKILLIGIDNPKPVPAAFPTRPYTTLSIKSNMHLEAWLIEVEKSIGTIVLFHGYSGEKSSLLTRAEEFNKLGYNTLLVDFMGSGGSDGNSTSIGFIEAKEVNSCYSYLKYSGENNIHLFGTSMGAAAVLRSVMLYNLNPTSIILECPFGSLYQTTRARFNLMGVPAVPMAGILTFWGGFQQGYWAFGHNPEEYAKDISCPTLLMYGEQDDRVSMKETQTIFKNLQGKKVLATYPNEGHQIFTPENKMNWINDVTSFLTAVDTHGIDISHYSPSL